MTKRSWKSVPARQLEHVDPAGEGERAPAMVVERRHARAVAGRVADRADRLDRHRRDEADVEDVVGLEVIAERPGEIRIRSSLFTPLSASRISMPARSADLPSWTARTSCCVSTMSRPVREKFASTSTSSSLRPAEVAKLRVRRRRRERTVAADQAGARAGGDTPTSRPTRTVRSAACRRAPGAGNRRPADPCRRRDPHALDHAGDTRTPQRMWAPS